MIAFEKVSLKPGQSKNVTLQIDAKNLAFWDTKNNKWKLELGTFELMVGSSSADIRLKDELNVK
jgi:beta-glucosidase